jgi:hypothetical protein
MSDRTTLTQRRASTTLRLLYADVEGLSLNAHITYSRDAKGEIREVFVSAGKPGSPGEASLRDAGLLLSLLLQRGMTITAIRSALTRAAEDRPGSQVGVIVDALAAEPHPLKP